MSDTQPAAPSDTVAAVEADAVKVESAFVTFVRANAMTATIGAFCVGFLIALILF